MRACSQSLKPTRSQETGSDNRTAASYVSVAIDGCIHPPFPADVEGTLCHTVPSYNSKLWRWSTRSGVKACGAEMPRQAEHIPCWKKPCFLADTSTPPFYFASCPSKRRGRRRKTSVFKKCWSAGTWLNLHWLGSLIQCCNPQLVLQGK
jgi:hypothetical protein